MALDVKVKIDLTQPIGELGFGIPLILAENTTSDIDYVKCTNLTEVITAGYAATSKTYKAANLIFMQENPPAEIAVCSTKGTASEWLGEVENTGKEWRQLMVVNEGETPTEIATIMAAVETMDNKLYFASLAVDDSTTLTTADMERTVLFYCTSTEDMQGVEVAAFIGATAGKEVGSITYKNQILKGITPQNLSDSQITAIHNKGGITFVTKAGDNVTTEGKVAGGEYIDIIDSEDYIIQQLEYKTQKALNNADKIPYTDTGIAMLESIAVDVLQDAYNNGMIATGEDGSPAYTVRYALRENSTETDRAARKYVGGQFSFTLSGAVHSVEIVGEVII